MKGTWCLISVANNQIRARIMHIGRGRFRILEDESGKYSEQKIDASDILHCRG